MSVDDETPNSVFDMIGVKWCSVHPNVWIAYPGLWAHNIRDCPMCHLALISTNQSSNATSIIGSGQALVKTISARKLQISNDVSNTLHKIAYTLKTFAGYDLPHPETYQNFPFKIGDVEIHAKDCLSCERWIYFASFSRAERDRQKTSNNLEKFCVFLLGQRDKLLTVRTNFIDLEARSSKLHRIHEEFILQREELKSPSHEDFVDWVAFNTSCKQLDEKEQNVVHAFELYKKRKYSVLDIAEQVQKAEISLKARNIAVKIEKMNDLLFYIPEFVQENESFIVEIENKLKSYESHLDIVKTTLKKLIDNQEFEID